MKKKKQDKTGLQPNEVIEVVMRKKMTVSAYESIITQYKRVGWKIQGFQIGVFSVGSQKEI